MKSIAYITTTFPTLAWFVENEVHSLRERGVPVQVFTLRGVGRQYQPEHEPLIAITRCLGSPFSLESWRALLGWLMRRPHVLIAEAIHIVWASRRSLYALMGHLYYLPAAARIARVVETERIDHLHGAWAHFPGSVAFLAARLTGCRFSLAGHAGGDLFRSQAFLAEKARAATFVMACVRQNARMIETLAPGVRVHDIYHGVDLRRFDGALRVRSPQPTLLAVGRLARTKGFDVAIRALALLRERGLRARLVIVGDGPERADLERWVKKLNLSDQVELTGALNHEALIQHYRMAWVLLAPSIVFANGRQDGIPNVVVEAMAVGVPCVGTDAGGITEVVFPGVTGALCAQGDPLSMANALEPLLRHPDALDQMGMNARQRTLRDFDAKRNVERVIELLLDHEAASHEPVEPLAQGVAIP